MKERVLCPNCGRPMRCARTLPLDAGEDEHVHVYECASCKVNFITEDHLPVAGVVVPPI